MARRLTVIGATVVATAIIAASCAEDEPVFDPAIVLDAVQTEINATGIEAVACAGLTAEDAALENLPDIGGEFECVGTLSGDPVDLLVTVSPAIDGQISVATDVRSPLFDVAAAEVAAAARLDADLGGSPEVACEERVVVTAPGRRIACRVTAEGGTAGPVDRSLAIVLIDADGNWEIDLFG